MDGSRYGRRRSHRQNPTPDLPVGTTATVNGVLLRTFHVGAVPLVNHYLERLQLAKLLRQYLPAEDVRQNIPTARIVLLLVRNVLLLREPPYGIPEWVARHAPDRFDLFQAQVAELLDDRLGSCLARLFRGTTPELLLALVRRSSDEFGVSLDELRNDSTSVSFYGLYAGARQPIHKRGRLQPAITYGHTGRCPPHVLGVLANDKVRLIAVNFPQQPSHAEVAIDDRHLAGLQVVDHRIHTDCVPRHARLRTARNQQSTAVPHVKKLVPRGMFNGDASHDR